jgi:hypothetical protein
MDRSRGVPKTLEEIIPWMAGTKEGVDLLIHRGVIADTISFYGSTWGDSFYKTYDWGPGDSTCPDKKKEEKERQKAKAAECPGEESDEEERVLEFMGSDDEEPQSETLTICDPSFDCVYDEAEVFPCFKELRRTSEMCVSWDAKNNRACFMLKHRRGMCRVHYELWIKSSNNTCSSIECFEQACRYGVCQKHYVKTLDGERRCTAIDDDDPSKQCSAKHRAKGYCRKHYRRFIIKHKTSMNANIEEQKSKQHAGSVASPHVQIKRKRASRT